MSTDDDRLVDGRRIADVLAEDAAQRVREAAARDETAFEVWMSRAFGVPISEPISEPERGEDDDAAVIDLHAGARQPATDGDAQLDAWIDRSFGIEP